MNRGFTLIETMIAITLSSTILLLVFESLVSSRQSYQNFVGNHHRNANVVLIQQFLENQVNAAGVYFGNSIQHLYTQSCGNFNQCSYNSDNSDQIALWHLPISGKDCIGNNVAPLEPIVTILSIADNSFGENSLYCQSYQPTTASFTSYKQPIFDGIIDMQIQVLQQKQSSQLISTNIADIENLANLVGVTFALIVAGQLSNTTHHFNQDTTLTRLDAPSINISTLSNATQVELFYSFYNRNVSL